MRQRLTIALLVLLLVAACRKEVDESQNGPSKNSISQRRINPVPDRSRTDNAPTIVKSASPAAQIDLLEGSIHMARDYQAGILNFYIVNEGKETHSLIIEGNGIQTRVSADLARGDTASLTVDLKPGSYSAYCPLAGHRAAGESAAITVK